MAGLFGLPDVNLDTVLAFAALIVSSGALLIAWIHAHSDPKVDL